MLLLPKEVKRRDQSQERVILWWGGDDDVMPYRIGQEHDTCWDHSMKIGGLLHLGSPFPAGKWDRSEGKDSILQGIAPIFQIGKTEEKLLEEQRKT